MNRKDTARSIILWELIECRMAVSTRALRQKEQGGAARVSTVSCMQTDEYKKELEKGEIDNPKLVSYIRESDEDFERERYDFVEGLQDDDTGEHFLIFTWDALFVREVDAYQYIKYEDICDVKEDSEGLGLILRCGYQLCDDKECVVGGSTVAEENIIEEERTCVVRRDARGRALIRPLKRMLRKILALYNGYDKDQSARQEIEDIICKRVENVIKSSDTAVVYIVKNRKLDQGAEKKLDNALAKYAVKVKREDVVAFIDTSFLGNGKDGLLFTGEGIAFDFAFEKVFLKYSEIEEAEFDKKKKHIVFTGDFAGQKDDTLSPEIEDIYFDLNELKACMDEILYRIG